MPLPKPEPQATEPDTHNLMPAHQADDPGDDLKGRIIASDADTAIADALKRLFSRDES